MTHLFQIPPAPMHLVEMPDGGMKLYTPPPMVAVPPRDGVHLYAIPTPNGWWHCFARTDRAVYRLVRYDSDAIDTRWYGSGAINAQWALRYLELVAIQPIRRHTNGDMLPRPPRGIGAEAWKEWTAEDQRAYEVRWAGRIVDLFNRSSYGPPAPFDEHLGHAARPIAGGLPPDQALRFAAVAVVIERSTGGGVYGQTMALLREACVNYQARGFGDPIAAVTPVFRSCGADWELFVHHLARYSGEIAAAAYEAAKEANAHGWRPLVEPSIEDRRWLAEVLLCRMPKTPIFSQLHAGILATKKVLDKQVSALNDLERAPDVAAAVAAAHGASNCGVPADVIQERLDEWAAGHLTGLSFVVS